MEPGPAGLGVGIGELRLGMSSGALGGLEELDEAAVRRAVAVLLGARYVISGTWPDRAAVADLYAMLGGPARSEASADERKRAAQRSYRAKLRAGAD